MLRPGLILMAAVLQQAVADLESRSFNVRRQARAWFLASNARANHVFAFSRICQEFGCDAAVVRSRIFAGASNTVETNHPVRDGLHTRSPAVAVTQDGAGLRAS